MGMFRTVFHRARHFFFLKPTSPSGVSSKNDALALRWGSDHVSNQFQSKTTYWTRQDSLEEAAMGAGKRESQYWLRVSMDVCADESPLRHELLNFADGTWRFRAPGRPTAGRSVRAGAGRLQSSKLLLRLLLCCDWPQPPCGIRGALARDKYITVIPA